MSSLWTIINDSTNDEIYLNFNIAIKYNDGKLLDDLVNRDRFEGPTYSSNVVEVFELYSLEVEGHGER